MACVDCGAPCRGRTCAECKADYVASARAALLRGEGLPAALAKLASLAAPAAVPRRRRARGVLHARLNVRVRTELKEWVDGQASARAVSTAMLFEEILEKAIEERMSTNRLEYLEDAAFEESLEDPDGDD